MNGTPDDGAHQFEQVGTYATQIPRRVHGADFKTQVMAECQQPGASVEAVALAHGLNVNLLRKWLVGRGIKRTGLAAPRTVTRKPAGVDASVSTLQ